MLAALCLEREITIKITTVLESKPYIDITAEVMRNFGHIVEFSGNEIKIRKGKTEISQYTVEKDWSQTAFFLVGGLVSGEVKVNEMNLLSSQGDKKILDVLKSFGGNITIDNNTVIAKKSKLKAIKIDVSDIPDLVPILSVAAAMAEGTTHIYNAGRLRIKESDRLLSVTRMFEAMDIPVKMGEDHLEITGKGYFKGGSIDSFNDHRIVMSGAIMALNAEETVEIKNYKAVNKSYPEFFEDYSKLGGKGEIVK
jgi:3-phosphoshikimate 1-carboxyvinyltransferase